VSSARLAVSYTIKANPTLNLTSATCSADLLTYTIVFVSDGTVTSTSGTVNNTNKTVSGIPAETDVTLTATLNGCTTDLGVTAPNCNCPAVAAPADGVPAVICFGDDNTAISATVGTGETIDWYADATGGTALLPGSLSYTSPATAAGVYTYYAEARNTTSNCVSSSRLAVTTEILSTPIITNVTKIDPPICQGLGSLFFTFTDIPDATYTITYDGGSFAGVVVSNGKATVQTTARSYNNLTINVDGCASASGINAILSDPNPPATPIISVQNNCGESVLTASNYTGTLSWDTGESTQSITVSEAREYTLTQTINGCTSNAANAMANPGASVPKPEIELENYCGESNVFITNLIEDGWFVWQYNNTTDSIQSDKLTLTEPGDYTFIQKVQNCASAGNTITVSPQAIPSQPITDNQEVCAAEPIQTLIAEAETPDSNTSVIWYDSPVDGNKIQLPFLDTIGTITYYAESQNSTTGCVSNARTPTTLTIKNLELSLVDTTIIGKPGRQAAVLIFPADSLKYQWFLNEDEITNATNQYYYIFESDRKNGNVFTVEVELQNGCKAKYDFEYTGSSSTDAINAFNKSGLPDTETLFTIYPNPTNTNFNIAIDTKQLSDIENLTVKVFSINGAFVMEIPLNRIPQRVETGRFKPGLYSVILYNNQQRLQAKKLTITQH